MCYALPPMATKPPIASSLNPNAPVFVPAFFLAAEDFSPEWWRLIQTSTSFREWWMKERFAQDEQQAGAETREQNEFDEIDELLELGFQPGILEGLDEAEEPAAAVPVYPSFHSVQLTHGLHQQHAMARTQQQQQQPQQSGRQHPQQNGHAQQNGHGQQNEGLYQQQNGGHQYQPNGHHSYQQQNARPQQQQNGRPHQQQNGAGPKDRKPQ